jgi:hypothetical protein
MAVTKRRNGRQERSPKFKGQWKLVRFKSREQCRDIRKAAKLARVTTEQFMLSASEHHAVRVIKAEEKAT